MTAIFVILALLVSFELFVFWALSAVCNLCNLSVKKISVLNAGLVRLKSIKVARITTLMVKEKGVDNKTLNKYAY